ncbi:hypothetical protein Hanom_Chr17g01531451 [Helianthus anomalus]
MCDEFRRFLIHLLITASVKFVSDFKSLVQIAISFLLLMTSSTLLSNSGRPPACLGSGFFLLFKRLILTDLQQDMKTKTLLCQIFNC